jgi:segregation and condensation protein A
MTNVTFPSWRRALNSAWGEIRSIFGLCPQPPSFLPAEEGCYRQRLEEILNFAPSTSLTFDSLDPDSGPAEAAEQVTAHNADTIAAHTIPAESLVACKPSLVSVPTAEPAIEAAPRLRRKAAKKPALKKATGPSAAKELLVEPWIVQLASAPARKAAKKPAVKKASEPPAARELLVGPWIVQQASAPARKAAKKPVLKKASESSAAKKPLAEAWIVEQASAPAYQYATEQQQAQGLDQTSVAKSILKQKRPDDNAEESPFSISVGQVYDGPLDLLLDLIRRQDIDIYDIPIAKITAEFLAYVNQLKASDVDVAGEFIYTASMLIHIKSKMLLPRAPSGPDDAADDPRRELVERLLEHERFKNAAQMLQQKQMLEAATWSNPGSREFQDDVAAEPEIAADTDDLVRIFRDILDRARTRPVIDMEEDTATVGQMIQFLARRLTMEDKPIALRRLLSHTRSEKALIAIFLALLELVRLQAVLLRQDRAFSEIFIKKQAGFEAIMNQGLANARDDWR